MPLLVVFGATGAQGGSVVRHVLAALPEWNVRAVTRDSASAEAQALTAGEHGSRVGLFKADVTNALSLPGAFEGADAAVLLTNFWTAAQMGKELTIGTQLVATAKAMGVRHLLWSTLANVRVLSADKWKVPHFSDKAAVDEVILRSGFEHVTFFLPAFYYQNLLGKLFCKPDPSNPRRFVYIMPDVTKDAFDVRDTGKAVVAALREPEKYGRGTYLPLSGARLKMSEYIRAINEAAGDGEEHAHEPLSIEEYGNAVSRELAATFGWAGEYGYFGNIPHDAAQAAFIGDLKLVTPADFFAAHFAAAKRT